MDYDEAINYLTDLTKFGFNFGLGRIQELLRRLGNPHLKLKVLHVGGTNGKGSTCAFASSILYAAGYRVGTFTSPHLHSYTERYVINGREIERKRLAGLITRLKPHLEAMVKEGFEHPTEFEVSTACAFQYFLEEKVDAVVLEVGLGGAIDSTNVVSPLVAIITNVAMDHMDYLGHTLEEIAAVKAGIIKEGVPVVTAATGVAYGVIEKRCQSVGAPLYTVGGEIKYTPLGYDLCGQHFNLNGIKSTYADLFVALLGAHQLANAAVAVAAVELFTEKGFSVSGEHIRRGLGEARWPARMELFKGKPRVLLDGAHNYDGALSLKRALGEFFPGEKPVMVIGMLGDKERSKVVDELAPLSQAVVVTRPPSTRAGDWRQLARQAEKYVSVHEIEDIPGAIKLALQLAGPDGLVCVTGSLYMVGDARALLAAGNSPDREKPKCNDLRPATGCK